MLLDSMCCKVLTAAEGNWDQNYTSSTVPSGTGSANRD